eukprot:6877069-Pyramimonas_sp.AAC.1
MPRAESWATCNARRNKRREGGGRSEKSVSEIHCGTYSSAASTPRDFFENAGFQCLAGAARRSPGSTITSESGARIDASDIRRDSGDQTRASRSSARICKRAPRAETE